MPFYRIVYNESRIEKLRGSDDCQFPEEIVICAENENRAKAYASHEIVTSKDFTDTRNSKYGRAHWENEGVFEIISLQDEKIEKIEGFKHKHEGEEEYCKNTMLIYSGKIIKLPHYK